MKMEPEIQLTKNQDDIRECALMMSRTDPWITLGLDYDACLDAFKGDFREVYVCRSGNDIAGFAILQVCGTFSGYIQSLCINESYRGKGLGTMMLKFCEKRILKFSPNIFICVSSFNEGAKKLYLRYGFRIIGELENFVRDGFSEILMRKTVGPRAGYRS